MLINDVAFSFRKFVAKENSLIDWQDDGQCRHSEAKVADASQPVESSRCSSSGSRSWSWSWSWGTAAVIACQQNV